MEVLCIFMDYQRSEGKDAINTKSKEKRSIVRCSRNSKEHTNIATASSGVN